MANVKPKTIAGKQSVSSFLKGIDDKQRQNESIKIIEIIKKESGFEPEMWGTSIIGFGSYHYKYESGREGDAPLISFSPRKTEFAFYIANFEGKDNLLKKLGKYRMAKACVYIKKVEDVNVDVLKKMIISSIKHYQEKYK